MDHWTDGQSHYCEIIKQFATLHYFSKRISNSELLIYGATTSNILKEERAFTDIITRYSTKRAFSSDVRFILQVLPCRIIFLWYQSYFATSYCCWFHLRASECKIKTTAIPVSEVCEVERDLFTKTFHGDFIQERYCP